MRAMIRFLQNDDGPIAVEYSMMVALILIAALTAISTLGGDNAGFWGGIDSKATSAFDAAQAVNAGN